MTEAEKVLAWCNGNSEAARLVSDLVSVSQIADDLVDQDKPGDRADEMARLLHLCLVTIPANPYFVKVQGWIVPMISASILAWRASAHWEKEDDETSRAFAFVYRDTLELVIVQVAHLTGGLSHAMRMQDDLFRYVRFMHRDGQSFQDWKNEVTA